MNPVSQTAKFFIYRIAFGGVPDVGKIVGGLVRNRLASEPHLQPDYNAMTDEQARRHFGEEENEPNDSLLPVVRYFHAWRLHAVRERLGERLAGARVLDVGDTDGLMLKHLGKTGLGFNLSSSAVRNIEANGIEAKLGDGHGLPFGDGEFDVVLCFETLEHVENQHQVLLELARVCRPGGRVFVSIPWVPRTFIHPRQTQQPRGAMHVFELCREDFASLLSHTPLRIVGEDVCEVIGAPTTVMQHLYLWRHRRDHIIGGTFRRFQFFELALKA